MSKNPGGTDPRPEPGKNPNKTQGSEEITNPKGAEELASKLASQGPLRNIPDSDKLQPLPPEDTATYLNELAERILSERRQHLRQNYPMVPSTVKDW